MMQRIKQFVQLSNIPLRQNTNLYHLMTEIQETWDESIERTDPTYQRLQRKSLEV
jgi:hypothetical protein